MVGEVGRLFERGHCLEEQSSLLGIPDLSK